MMTIRADIRFSRRKRIHAVLDHDGTVIWTGPDLDRAIEFALDHDQNQVWIEGEYSRFKASFTRESV